MGSYYKHKRSEKVEVPYSFQCEHCGKDSGLLKAVLVGTEATDNSNFKTLSQDREDNLCKRAHEYLVQKVKETHKDAEEKIFSTEFRDQCPNCRQPQSWAVSGLKKKMFENPLVCLGVGAFFAVIAVIGHYFTDEEYMTLTLAAGIFGVGVAAAVACLVWNVVKINIKSKKTAVGMHNFPVIDWSGVQSLLNEP